eukprot:tig00000204_g17732.t1
MPPPLVQVAGAFKSLSHLSLHEALDDAKERIQKLERENKLLGQVVEELRASKQKQVEELEAVRRQAGDALAERDLMKLANDELEKRTKKLQKELSETHATQFLSTGAISAVEGERTRLAARTAELESLALDLANQLESAKSRRALEQELEGKTRRELEQQLERAQARARRLEGDLKKEERARADADAALEKERALLRGVRTEAEGEVQRTLQDAANTISVLGKSEGLLRRKLARALEQVRTATHLQKEQAARAAGLEARLSEALKRSQLQATSLQRLELAGSSLRGEVRRLQEELLDARTAARMQFMKRAIDAVKARLDAGARGAGGGAGAPDNGPERELTSSVFLEAAREEDRLREALAASQASETAALREAADAAARAGDAEAALASALAGAEEAEEGRLALEREARTPARPRAFSPPLIRAAQLQHMTSLLAERAEQRRAERGSTPRSGAGPDASRASAASSASRSGADLSRSSAGGSSAGGRPPLPDPHSPPRLGPLLRGTIFEGLRGGR